MRVLLTCALAVLLAGAVHAQADEPEPESWNHRDLTQIERLVLKWIDDGDQERILKMSLEDAQEELASLQKRSPYKMPWTRKDLAKEKDGGELTSIFKELERDDQERLTTRTPFIDGVIELRRHIKENKGDHVAANMKIEIEEPEIRNPGTANARILVKGKTSGVEEGQGIRATAELRFPNPDSLPVLAKSTALVKKNAFRIEMRLPKKRLLLGKYWVRVRLDFRKTRDRKRFMADGRLPEVFATRVAWAGVEEEHRLDPDNAPGLIQQDIDLKLMYWCLIDDTPIPIGDATHPTDSPDITSWEKLNADLAQTRMNQEPQGLVPASKLRTMLEEKATEMDSYFDQAAWREFLDGKMYPAIEAGDRYLRQHKESVLRLRFPEISRYFVDRQGVYKVLAEWAALESKRLYADAGLEFPDEDRRRVRVKSRTVKDCQGLIRNCMRFLKMPTKGTGIDALLVLYGKLPAKRRR